MPLDDPTAAAAAQDGTAGKPQEEEEFTLLDIQGSTASPSYRSTAGAISVRADSLVLVYLGLIKSPEAPAAACLVHCSVTLNTLTCSLRPLHLCPVTVNTLTACFPGPCSSATLCLGHNQSHSLTD